MQRKILTYWLLIITYKEIKKLINLTYWLLIIMYKEIKKFLNQMKYKILIMFKEIKKFLNQNNNSSDYWLLLLSKVLCTKEDLIYWLKSNRELMLLQNILKTETS